MNSLTFIFAVCAVTYTMAAPRTLPALEQKDVRDEMGQYSLRYVTAEGTIVVENGRLISTPDGKGKVMVTEGQVSYIGDDGKKYVTKYTAGLDGFQAEGDHLPVAPEPVPVEVTTKIEYE